MAKIAVDTLMLKYYDNKSKARMEAADQQVLSDSKEYAKEYADGLNEAMQGAVDAVAEDVGNIENLETTNKTDLVNAINEVKNSVSAGNTASAITVTTDTTTEGALKSYTIKQGNNTIGTIDIPKDMVVESGTVVTNPEGQAEGTYIKLVLANVTDPLYINVGTLVDIYKAKANATQIQIAIDSATREISATIVAGSVGTTELADGSVTTVKIADANVTLAKLSTAVQASLAKADSAVQSVTTGSGNGTVSVDGTDVAVKGLGSAAFTESSAYDASGSAAAVQGKLNEEVERAKAAEAKVLEDAQKYADQKTAGVDLSGIQTNADAIDALKSRVEAEESKSTNFESRIAALEETKWATEADIDAIFE